MPLPNYFLGATGPAADGLNIAGYAWQQPVATIHTYEAALTTASPITNASRSATTFFNTQLPGALPACSDQAHKFCCTVVLNSILRPNLLNAVRIGIVRPPSK
jgi:hypothetical protein